MPRPRYVFKVYLTKHSWKKRNKLSIKGLVAMQQENLFEN